MLLVDPGHNPDFDALTRAKVGTTLSVNSQDGCEGSIQSIVISEGGGFEGVAMGGCEGFLKDWPSEHF